MLKSKLEVGKWSVVADVLCDQEVDVALENLAEDWKKGYGPEVIRARGSLLLGYRYNDCFFPTPWNLTVLD